MELARIALASLEAEAVGYVDAEYAELLKSGHIESCSVYAEPGEGCITLFTAPPAPVSVPDAMDVLGGVCCEVSYADGWNACRAAMLQGTERVTTAYKLPANTPCKEAPEHIWLQTAGVWPENGEFSELTWCSDNQHDDDTLYVRADVATGNSPVIGEGRIDEAI